MTGQASKASSFVRAVCYVVMAALALPVGVGAQTPPPQGAAPSAAPSGGGGQNFKQEELDQMLAPIALYPDALVTQVLMASTYPLDIVEAARWRAQNKDLKGDQLQTALQSQPWDESVKSLTEFPDVLDRMNKDLAWTQKLGDAFLGQQKQVLDTIQSLRQRAQSAGNLKSNEYQKVDTQTQEGKQVIVIEPANPQIVYVPTYQPTVVYGAWPYPAYPPYYPTYWAPVGAAFASGFMWGVGIAAGAALWGGCNWGRGDVNVNVNRYNNFNKTNISNGNWNHNADRRGGVPYRDNGARQQYGGQRDRQATQARNDFRGREGSLGGQGLNDRAGRADAASRGVGQQGAGGRDFGGQGAGAGNRDFGGAGGGNRAAGASVGQRDFGASSAGAANRGGGGFNSGGGGAQTRDFSNRGNASMGNRSYGGGGGGGGARAGGGGGGARGGGGGRGGGGRR